MAKYNVHAGHCPDGKGASGAVGLLKESTEARKVKNLVIKKLKQKGHTVYDCTCDVKTTQSGCLVKIVDKCNKHKVSYDISIHLNSGRNDRKGDGKTGGVEAWIYDTANIATKKKAESIVKAICTETGLSTHGAAVKGCKQQGVSLYVLRKTKRKAILIECACLDDADDKKLWSPEKVASGIVKGLI